MEAARRVVVFDVVRTCDGVRPKGVARILRLRLGLVLTLLGGSALAAPPPVSLTVAPASAQYTNQVEDISVQATLSLGTSASGPVTVCTFAPGSVSFNKVSKDGARLKPARSGVLRVEPLSLFQGRSFVTLEPGQSASFPLRFVRRGDHSVELKETRASKKRGPDPALTYTLTVPGTYSFSVTYKYTGPDGGHADIYRRATKSNTVTLTLVP